MENYEWKISSNLITSHAIISSPFHYGINIYLNAVKLIIDIFGIDLWVVLVLAVHRSFYLL